MRARDFLPEDSYEDAYRQQWQQFQPDGEEQRAGMVLRWQQVRPNRILVQARSGDGSRELGSVQFHRYDPASPKWTGEALHVDERYRRQGVATAMYDWFKKKFGPIRPSDAQTRDGESFWQSKKVWEQGVAEGENHDIAISLSRLGKFHPGEDPLAEFVPERATAQYALHPDKWQSTFYSLTNKDSDKIRYYGPKKISIPPGTLVGDMAIANKFYRAKTSQEKQQYADAYRESLQPYPVDVSLYRMPELLMPKPGVAEGWRENLAAAGIAGALATGTPTPAQAQATAVADPIVATLQIDGETRRLDLSSKGFQDVREAERWLADFMRARGIVGWQGKIERGTPGTGRYQRVIIQGAGGLDERRITGGRR